MKAVVQDRYGAPGEVLRVDDIDKPAPGDGEVLVQVHAAGIDQGVWHAVAGMPYLYRAFAGLRRPRARVPGMDVAGRVVAVGAKVTRFRPGEEVFGTARGSFAEYACARENALAPKPANLTFEQAAAVPVSGVTALRAVRTTGRVRAGQRVLVIGAGGGIGTYAVQLAKAFGAHVTGVCSGSKVDLVTSIGADEVIDYTREDCTDGRRRYDLVVDIAGGRSPRRLRHALTPRGTAVLVGIEEGGRWVEGTGRPLKALALSAFVGQRLRGLLAIVRTPDLETLRELIEAGQVTPVVDRTYPLAQAAAAIGQMRSRNARGKLVLTVQAQET